MTNENNIPADTDIEWHKYVTGVPQTSADDLDQLQQDLSMILPESYRLAVMAYAGCVPMPGLLDVIDIDDAAIRTSMGHLYYVSKDPSRSADPDNLYNVLTEIREGELAYWMQHDERRMQYLPFCGDVSLGYLCFDYGQRKDNPPVVWLNIKGSPQDYGFDKVVTTVADGFDALMAKLHE